MPVQSGTGILRRLVPGMQNYSPDETRFEVMDDFEGVVSLMSKGNSAPASFSASVLTYGLSSLTQMWGHGTSTVSSADWVASLKRGAVIRFQKAVATALGVTMLYMTAVDPASMRHMLEWGGL